MVEIGSHFVVHDEPSEGATHFSFRDGGRVGEGRGADGSCNLREEEGQDWWAPAELLSSLQTSLTYLFMTVCNSARIEKDRSKVLP